jgi:hypothetical protein
LTEPHPSQNVEFDLTGDERRLLMAGLNEWSGPARPTEELALALGFSGVNGLYSGTQVLRRSLAERQPLSPLDWTRALAATEFVFASDVFGSGCDWSATTGLSDIETITLLRGLQRKLVSVYAPSVGTVLGRRPIRT